MHPRRNAAAGFDFGVVFVIGASLALAVDFDEDFGADADFAMIASSVWLLSRNALIIKHHAIHAISIELSLVENNAHASALSAHGVQLS
ncbi:MAG TPA: hypothetical protein VGD52_20485 [Pseudoduganella sp.]